MTRLAAFCAGVLLLAGCGGAAHEAAPADDAPKALGLFTTLPLYWGEGGDIGDLIDAPRDPARAALETRYALQPLDVLDPAALAGLGRLAMVQPRVLAPQENVALDAWVRAGGRLVLFADPLLTRHSRFALGDKRRPQDVALVSPLLAHWGLALSDRDEDAPRTATILGEAVPVDHPGTLALAPGPAEASCTILDAGLAARCAIGAGQAVIVADAALFDDHADTGAAPLARVVANALGD